MRSRSVKFGAIRSVLSTRLSIGSAEKATCAYWGCPVAWRECEIPGVERRERPETLGSIAEVGLSALRKRRKRSLKTWQRNAPTWTGKVAICRH